MKSIEASGVHLPSARFRVFPWQLSTVLRVLMMCASLLLFTKCAPALRHFQGRGLTKPGVLESPRFLKTLRTPPIISPMEGTGGAAAVARVSTAANGSADRFELSPSSVLKLQKGDITAWFVDGSTDAIVNAANERMLGGGGVDGAIHRAAGPELRAACYDVPEVRPGVRCPTGEAKITPAFRLPVSHVIHTVGPIYDVHPQPEVSLRNAYRNCLRLAKENNIKYIAFPAISCGVYGYPYNEASRVAISTIKEFSADIKEVHFVLFSDDIYRVWVEAAGELL